MCYFLRPGHQTIPPMIKVDPKPPATPRPPAPKPADKPKGRKLQEVEVVADEDVQAILNQYPSESGERATFAASPSAPVIIGSAQLNYVPTPTLRGVLSLN